MYYGGDPPAWTTMPDIPPDALFKPPEASSSRAGEGAIADLAMLPPRLRGLHSVI